MAQQGTNLNQPLYIQAPLTIDGRLIVDTVDGIGDSLVSLIVTNNYPNMYVWVRSEKSFYYLIDSPTAGGATVTDWAQASGGVGATGCAKSGYVPGTSFIGTGDPGSTSSASVFFTSPYQSASYSVAVTGEQVVPDYIYSVTDKTTTGFTIVIDTPVPIGATAMWITNCWDGSGLFNGGGGSSISSFLPLPIPKINLMQGTQSVQVYQSSDNTISGTSAVIHNYPVLINMDFTSDHFSNPNNKIFIEMVYYRRKSRKSINFGDGGVTPNTVKTKGKSYVVPAKNIEGVGQDTSLPWIVAAMAVGATGSWSRSGSQNYFTGVPIGIDRPNHVEVTGYTISSYPIWQYLNGRFEFYDVRYADATIGGISPFTLQTLIPNSGKGKAGKNQVPCYPPTVTSSGSRFPYSPYYTPYYCAFRYIQWIPNVNPRPGGGYYGQIVSGPLSKVIKVTGLHFPFQTNYLQSAVFGYPVCDISAYWTANPDSYRSLKCDWESNVP